MKCLFHINIKKKIGGEIWVKRREDDAGDAASANFLGLHSFFCKKLRTFAQFCAFLHNFVSGVWSQTILLRFLFWYPSLIQILSILENVISIIMHPLRGPKGRDVADRQRGGALVFSQKLTVLYIPSKKKSSGTFCLSVNCLL